MTVRKSFLLKGILWLLAGLLPSVSVDAQEQSRRRASHAEDKLDYYQKWLRQDVVYINTEEEKSVFSRLETDDEKDQFIEQFWLRRDPDPRTVQNEFKEEHYRRIAYANDNFESGWPGWKTDRGRIYIIHGPPDEIERNPSGGGYDRPFHEGGGGTATVPFERWWYRHIEGLGNDIELEFIDPTWTGEYRLALNSDEKDVFLTSPGHGATLAEQIGMANRIDRLTFRRSGANRELYPMMHHRAKDSAFARYETFTRIKTPAEIRYPDLKEAVSVEVSYDGIDFEVRDNYFLISGDSFLAPVTIEFPNRRLSYREQNGVWVAKIALYGLLTTITNQIVAEFEEDLISSFSEAQIEKGRSGWTLFQKLLPLEGRMRYKLTLVAKDVYGGKIGLVSRGLAPPRVSENGLSASSLVVADYIEQLQGDGAQQADQMFVLGDIKVRPAIGNSFPADGVLGLYLQVYQTGVDQATSSPSLAVFYRLFRDGRAIREFEDPKAASALFYGDQRVVVAKGLPLQGLKSGRYRVEVEVQDHIRDQSIMVSDEFMIR